MYNLWIDHLDIDKRCENDEHRFFLQKVGLTDGYSETSEVDFINYMDHSFYQLDLLITNDVDELAQKLCQLLPEFDKAYNSVNGDDCHILKA